MGEPSMTAKCGRPWISRSKPLAHALGLVLLFAGSAHGQAELDSVWQPFAFFAGAWEGRETGASGIGTGERVYAFIMDDTYLMSINTSRFEPQDRNPEGETHEDYAIFSYDRLRDKIVLREFHSEGFVNRYVLARRDDGGRRFVFESEAIESLPPGWRARITLTIIDKDHFAELFELAKPGEEHEELLINHWSRR